MRCDGVGNGVVCGIVCGMVGGVCGGEGVLLVYGDECDDV